MRGCDRRTGRAASTRCDQSPRSTRPAAARTCDQACSRLSFVLGFGFGCGLNANRSDLQRKHQILQPLAHLRSARARTGRLPRWRSHSATSWRRQTRSLHDALQLGGHVAFGAAVGIREHRDRRAQSPSRAAPSMPRSRWRACSPALGRLGCVIVCAPMVMPSRCISRTCPRSASATAAPVAAPPRGAAARAALPAPAIGCDLNSLRELPDRRPPLFAACRAPVDVQVGPRDSSSERPLHGGDQRRSLRRPERLAVRHAAGGDVERRRQSVLVRASAPPPGCRRSRRRT